MEAKLAGSFAPIEVGCEGFTAQSLCKAMTGLKITSGTIKKGIWTIRKAAEKAL